MWKHEITLKHIANWIKKGFSSGYYPCWKLSFNDVQHNKLSDATLQHIAWAVSEGYIEGEVVEDNINNNGWWSIQF